MRCSPVPSIILLLSRWFRVGAVSRRAPNSQVRLSLPSGEATAMAPGARIPPLKTAPAGPRVERPGEGTHSHFCPLIPGHTDSAGGRGRIQSTPCSLFSPDPTLPGDCLPSGPVTESSKGHSTCPFSFCPVRDVVKPVNHVVTSPLPSFICCEMSFLIESNVYNTILVNTAPH